MKRLRNILACLCPTLLLLAGPAHAQKTIWLDNFEGGASARWTANGVWHIGSPNGGPPLNAHGYRSLSGAECASTENYAYSQDARIYCKSYLNSSNTLLIPATSVAPTLTFWHWLDFANAFGYVEIRTETGGWQQISPTYLNLTSGGNWVQSFIDLSAYAGHQVQFAFHFVSGPCCGNIRGWYVDDVAVTATRLTPLPQVIVPGTQTNYAGQTLAVTLSATNTAVTNAVFTFRLPSPSTNLSLTTDGVLTWTNTGIKNGVLTWTNNSVAPGTNTIYVAVTDNGSPPLSATNHFDLIFLPPIPPSVKVPTNLTISVGQTFTVTNSATNAFLPQATYIFKLPTPSTNVSLTTNGVLAWTNTAVPPGTYTVFVKVTDNSLPPLSSTNSFAVLVAPPSPVLVVSNRWSGSSGFRFSFVTMSNTTWRIQAATNLNAAASNWVPVFTNTTGAGGTLTFTDLLATNFLQRYYRAVYLQNGN